MAAATTAGEALSDEALMRALASGRQDAVGPLYARFAPRILAMAVQAVGRAAAEEIVQDVFVAVWKNARSFDPARGPVRPWILQIAHRRIANELRRRSRRPEVAADPEGPELSGVPDSGPDPSDEAWAAYRHDALRRALERLPSAQRQALGLSFFDELSHDEIARVLDLPLGTAKSRIRSGLKSLRASLAPVLALLLLCAGLAVVWLRDRSNERALDRDERALTMLTSSDTEALRLTAATGVDPSTHGVYRARRGTPMAVLTVSNLQPAPAGETYRGWALHGGRWTSLGTVRPDASGKARLTAEGPVFAERPDEVEVTLEPRPGGPAPAGRIVVRWAAP